MAQNFIRIIMGNDLAFVSVDNDIIVGRSHLANRIELITPVTLGSQDVMQIFFELANGNSTPKRSMFATGATVDVSGDQFNVYRYDIPQSVLSGITSANSSTLKVQFRKATIGEGEGNVAASGTATAGTSTTLTDSTKTFTTNQFQNFVLFIAGGTGAGQKRTIASNTATVLTVTEAFTVTPDTTSTYTIRPITTIAQALLTSAQVNLTLDGAIMPNADDEVIEIDVFDELSGAINDKLNKNFSGFAAKANPDDTDLIAIDEGNGTNKKVTVGTIVAAAVTRVEGLQADIDEIQTFVDQDVSIGSSPAFATPTVDGLTFRDNGNTTTIDYADALAINATQAHIDDATIHFLKGDVSKSDVGLGNVDNTSDLNKPVSTATQTALDLKQDTLVSGTNIKTLNNTSLVGSGNIDILSLIPSAVVFKGTFGSAGSTTGGDLPTSNQVTGDLYICDQNAFVSAAAGVTFQSGDKAIWTGTAWVRNAAADSVVSVNTKTGAVTLDKADIGLGNVTNDAQVTSVTGTAPIVSTGGTTPAISIDAATSEAAGSMSATDKAKLDNLTAATVAFDEPSFSGFLDTDPATTNVQAALAIFDTHDHVAADITDLSAATVSYDNDGQNLLATDVQAAIDELDDLVEEGLTQIVVVKFEITAADDTAGGFTYNRNAETGITGTFDSGKFVFTLPTGVEYVTGSNRIVAKIDGSDGALKRLFYGADSELTEPSATTFAIDFALVDNDVIYAKLFQSLATVSIDIADASITEGKIADGAVTTTKIANSNVTLAKLQDIATLTVLGNDTGGTAAVKAMTASETKVLLALNNVDNTSDSNKPISSNMATALDKIDNATQFYKPTNSNNSDLILNLSNGLNNGAALLIEVPSTLNDQTEDARLSIDDGASFRPIFNLLGTAAFKGVDVKGLQIRVALDTGNNRYQTLVGEYTAQQNNNIIEEVQAEGVALAVTGKAVNVTRASLGAGTGDADVFFFTTTIADTDWTGSEAPYTAVKTVSGILSTDRPILDLDLSAVAIGNVAAKQADWALVYRAAATDTNEISFFATDEPTESLVVQIKVVR
jgi:hypothetical protein